MPARFIDERGDRLSIDAPIYAVGVEAGAPQWASKGTVHDYGRTRLYVRWDNHTYDGPNDYHALVTEPAGYDSDGRFQRRVPSIRLQETLKLAPEPDPRYPNRMVTYSHLNDHGIVGSYSEDHFKLTTDETALILRSLSNYNHADDEADRMAGIIDMFRGRRGMPPAMAIVRTEDDEDLDGE